MTVEAPAARPEHPLRAILIMVAAVLCFTVLDFMAKFLVQDYSVFQLAWGRYGFNLLFMAVFLPALGWRGLTRTSRLPVQLGRGLLLVIATSSIFAAVRFLPLADTYAISFVAPVMVVALSITLLGETVDRRRWLAIFGGFLGVLVVIRPGSGVMSWPAIFPLIMATCWALYQVLTRLLAATEQPVPTLFYTTLVGTVATSLILPAVWIPPTAAVWAVMAAMGLVGMLGHLALFHAFTLAPASLLSPFIYTQIIWAILLGYWGFGDVPDGFTLLGSAIVVVSGIFLLHSRQKKRSTA